jgi:hypothetical protein
MRRKLTITLDDAVGFEGCVLEIMWADRERLSLDEAEQIRQFLDWYIARVQADNA